MKTSIILLLLSSVLVVSCADLAADCERLGTCVPAELEGGLPGAPLGTSCGAASACESGFCVDGVCCDTGCDPACGTCTAANSVGRCVAEAGLTCGDGICDGGGFCAAGRLEVVVTAGTDGDDAVASGAILPGLGVLVSGTAAPPPLALGELEATAGSARGFSGVVDARGSASRLQVWGDGPTTVDAAAGRPDGGAVLAGRFETTLAVGGASPVDNLEAPDGFVVALDRAGQPQWLHHLVSTPDAPARVEVMTASASNVALAGWATVDGQRQRIVRVLDANGAVRGELALELGEHEEQDGAVTGLAFDEAGRLWLLAEYRGEGSLQPTGSAPALLPRSSPLPGPPLTRTFLVALDANTLKISGGPHLMGTGDVRAGGLAVSGDTIYVGGGLASGMLELEPAPGSEPGRLVSDELGHDPFILALDPAGRRRWSAAWPSDAPGTTAQSLAISPAGDVAFTGSVQGGTLDLGGLPIGGKDREASFVGKLSPDGEHLLWRQPVEDAAGSCRLGWVGIAQNGQVWVTGSASGDVLGRAGLGGRDLVVAAFGP